MTPLVFMGCAGDVIHRATAILGPGFRKSDVHAVWACGISSRRAMMLTGGDRNDVWFAARVRKCEACFRPDRLRLKRKANTLVLEALKANELDRGLVCESCGLADHVRPSGCRELVAHHDDYGRPLFVRWLCRKCHARWHRANKALVPERAAS